MAPHLAGVTLGFMPQPLRRPSSITAQSQVLLSLIFGVRGGTSGLIFSLVPKCVHVYMRNLKDIAHLIFAIHT